MKQHLCYQGLTLHKSLKGRELWSKKLFQLKKGDSRTPFFYCFLFPCLRLSYILTGKTLSPKQQIRKMSLSSKKHIGSNLSSLERIKNSTKKQTRFGQIHTEDKFCKDKIQVSFYTECREETAGDGIKYNMTYSLGVCTSREHHHGVTVARLGSLHRYSI